MENNPKNRIVLGDYKTFFSTIEDSSVDLILTDPPFGINYQNNYTHKKHKKIVGDESFFSYQLLAKESYRILKPNTACFIFTGWSEYPVHFQEVKDSGFVMKEPLIGQKRPSGTSDLYGSFQTNCDWCMFAHKGRFRFKKTQLLRNKKAGVVPNKGRKPVPTFKTRMPSCWFGQEFPISSENSAYQKANKMFHPTIKGLEFIKWLIQLSTNPGDIVVDPFAGTGTVAEACIQLNRKYMVCEIDEEYVKYIRKRIGKYDKMVSTPST